MGKGGGHHKEGGVICPKCPPPPPPHPLMWTSLHMVENGRDEEERLLVKVEKLGRKLLAVLSVSVKKRSPMKLTCQLNSAATCNMLSHRGTTGSWENPNWITAV